MPLIVAPPQEAAKSTLESVIDGVKREVAPEEQEEVFERRLLEAAENTITLPAECLPPQLLQKSQSRVLPQPRRLLRSQLDPVFQASTQVVKPAELEQQTAFLAARQRNYLQQTKPKEFNPSARQLMLNKRYEEQWRKVAAEGNAKAHE